MVGIIFPLPAGEFEIFASLLQMIGRRDAKGAFDDLEIEHALEDLFVLPKDPKNSEDDLESEDEGVPYCTARLQKILEDLHEPAVSPHLLRSQPSPQSSDVMDTAVVSFHFVQIMQHKD